MKTRKQRDSNQRGGSFLKQCVVVTVLWVLVMVSGLSVIYSTHKSRQLQHRLETMRRQANELHVERSKFLLEKSTWAGYSHVESEAGEKLGMRVPSSDRIVVIER